MKFVFWTGTFQIGCLLEGAAVYFIVVAKLCLWLAYFLCCFVIDWYYVVAGHISSLVLCG